MYTKDGCPFCVKAKRFLADRDIRFTTHDLSDDELRKDFYRDTGTSSVPQIYATCDGEEVHIGGYDNLIESPIILGPQMYIPKEAYVFDYKAPVEMAKSQNDVFWTSDEIEVEKDVQDIMVNFTDSERHGVITVLKLFTLYELVAGNEYWGGRVKNSFPRPDIQKMANSFSYFEINVHAPFYNKINEALHLNNEEFYTDYVNDPDLKARMEFVDEYVNNEDDDLLSLAVFSMVEGAVLYSSFAFLKHFQSKGKNKLLNVVRGINFSVRDENLHCLGGAWLYKQLKAELEASRALGDHEAREQKIIDAAMQVRDHEFRVVDMIFEKGDIEGITKRQMQHFIESRIDECLKQLDMKSIFKVTYNPIAEWFYDGINGYQMNDFFTGIGNQYNRNWNEDNFTWEPEDGE